MKIGDTVICVNNFKLMYGNYVDGANYDVFKLTIDKKYVILSFVEHSHYISVIDDNGLENTFLRERFKTVQEYRDERLNQLL